MKDLPDGHSKDIYNENLEDIFNNINIGIAYVNLNGEVLAISRALVNILDIAETKLIGKNIVSIARQLLTPKDVTRIVPILLNLIQGNEIVPFEFNYRGKIIEVSASINHETKRLIGVIQDVTERKKAEADLRHSEELFRVLVDTVGEGIIFQDAEGKVIHWNKAAEKMFGIAAGEITGQISSKLNWNTVHEDGSPFPADEHPSLHTLKTGQPCDNVVMGIIKNEKETTWININTRPLFRENEQKPYAVAISFSDITGRKQAEAQIERLAQIADAAPSSITVFDFEGQILYANEHTFKMHGYSKNEFMKIRLHQLDVPESSALIDARIKKIKENGEAEFQVSHYRKDGSTFPLQVYVKQIEWLGQPAMLSVATDISAREKAEAELLELNKALEIQVQERAVVDAFTFSVSHDLRAPLRRISGFSEILLEEYAHHLDNTGQDYLNRINNQAVAMDDLVEALIRLSSITQHNIEVEMVNLGTIAESYIDHLRLKEPEREVQVLIEPELYARGDPELLRMVMAELIHNCWKFTKDNEQALIEVGAEEEGEQTVYYVRDNGSGFDMQYADKLFEPFKTLHQDEDCAGVGIGLNIAQRIIVRHGGKIHADGVEGEGATICFTLP